MNGEPPIVRFMEKLVLGPNGCWEWVGGRTQNGYGVFWYEGRLITAHRYAYLSRGRSIPDGHDMDHLCRNRGCVNPDHLEPVTRSENNRRGVRGYGARDVCMSGRHPIAGPEDYYVWTSGARTCRECAKHQARKSHRRRAQERAA